MLTWWTRVGTREAAWDGRELTWALEKQTLGKYGVGTIPQEESGWPISPNSRIGSALKETSPEQNKYDYH